MNEVFKKRHRWTFKASFPYGEIEERFVKIDARPEGGFVTTEYIDPSTSSENDFGLFPVLAKFYNFGQELFSDPDKKLLDVKDKLGEAELVLYDGCHNSMETWKLQGVWPHSVNFGDLCYSSSDSIDVIVTWGYQESELMFPTSVP